MGTWYMENHIAIGLSLILMGVVVYVWLSRESLK